MAKHEMDNFFRKSRLIFSFIAVGMWLCSEYKHGCAMASDVSIELLPFHSHSHLPSVIKFQVRCETDL